MELVSNCVGMFDTEELISMDDVKWKKMNVSALYHCITAREYQ